MTGYHEFEGGARVFLVVASFIVIIFIFLGSIKNSAGVSWLQYAWSYATSARFADGGGVIGAILLLLIIVGVVMYVGKSPKKSGDEE